MKNVFFILLSTLVVVLSSCSSDDISVGQSTTFKINPSSVIQSFTYEIEPGDLEGISSEESLRVRLLVYDSDNVLVRSETQYLSSYASIMTTNMDLEAGDYMAVVITDVVTRNGDNVSFACWELSDERSLTTARITDLGYIGGQSKILGIGSKNFRVSDGATEVSVNPSPAGSLLLVMWSHVHTFSDVEEMTLEVNRFSDYLVMNSQGGFDMSVENHDNQYDWRITMLAPSDYPDSNNLYSYYFIFPIQNISFRFRIDPSSGESIYTDPMPFNLKAGSEYYFELDLCDPEFDNGISYGGFEVTSTRSVSTKGLIQDIFNGAADAVDNHSLKLETLLIPHP